LAFRESELVMELFDLSELFAKQKELDLEIAKNHNITYQTTRTRRTIALLVEIGEFANSLRSFKYWSNKPGESKERVLDEYADGMHFFLSLGIDIGNPNSVFEIADSKLDVNEQILETYRLIGEFVTKQDVESYRVAFTSFLAIIPKINTNKKEVVDAYFSKLEVNKTRQKTNY